MAEGAIQAKGSGSPPPKESNMVGAVQALGLAGPPAYLFNFVQYL